MRRGIKLRGCAPRTRGRASPCTWWRRGKRSGCGLRPVRILGAKTRNKRLIKMLALYLRLARSSAGEAAEGRARASKSAGEGAFGKMRPQRPVRSLGTRRREGWGAWIGPSHVGVIQSGGLGSVESRIRVRSSSRRRVRCWRDRYQQHRIVRIAAQAQNRRHVTQCEQEISTAVSGGVSVSHQESQVRRYFCRCDSRMLRHGDLRPSPLSENDASEPRQLSFGFACPIRHH